MKENAVVLAGYYGYGNAGDELILRSLIHQLHLENVETRVIVLSNNPSKTARDFGVEAIHRWRPWSWIEPLWKSKRFMLGGGGLLQESTGSWNHFYYLGLVLLAKLFGCHTEIRAIGVDPIQGKLNRVWTGFVLNWAVDVVSVRDAESIRNLRSVGVLQTIRQTVDPVLQLSPPADRIPDEWRIALAVTDWPERSSWAEDLAGLCGRLRNHLGINVDLLIFFPDQDSALAQAIVDEHPDQAPRIRTWQTPEEILSWMPEYGLVIGMRYHALALSALAQRPFIGWGFQRKVRSLCQEFNQPAWPFERGWDVDAVFRQIILAWTKRGSAPKVYSSFV